MRIYKIKVNGKTYEVKVMGITETEPVEVKSEKVAVEKAPAAPASAPLSSARPRPSAYFQKNQIMPCLFS